MESRKVGFGVITIVIAATRAVAEVHYRQGHHDACSRGGAAPVGTFGASVPLAGTVATDDLGFAARPAGTGVLLHVCCTLYAR